MPLFPELRKYLEEAFSMSEEGAEWVIEGVASFDENRDNPTKPNLRRSALRSRKKAALYEWPDPMKNLRKTRQTELTNHYPQHVVCAWMGNSEKVAEKHYLHVTDGHMVAGSLTETVEKVGPKVGPDPTVKAHHAPSAKTVTLQKQAFPVTDRHDPSQEIPEWAMRDSTVHAFKAVNRGLSNSSKAEAVSPAVTNPTLSETVALLIDRWDSMTPRQKAWLSSLLKPGMGKWD